MSLPDTVFIFVLALIIFGPKKLPEIGRQLGRLVGEFRRASNEFKFQIEEELRLADFNDQRSSHPTIAAPADDTALIEDTSVETSTDTEPIYPEDTEDPAENLPVGQHPNIDMFDTSELNSSEMDPLTIDNLDAEPANVDSVELETAGESPSQNSVPTITPAAGAQARTKAPYAATEQAAESPDLPFPQNAVADDELLSSEIPASANSHTAPTEAEITHG